VASTFSRLHTDRGEITLPIKGFSSLNLKDEIQLDKGKLQIALSGRNNLFISGRIAGQEFHELNVDREYGTGKWRPGWLDRVCPDQQPELPKHALKAILKAVDKWASAETGQYLLDLAGQREIESDIEQLMTIVTTLDEEIEEAVSDGLEMFLVEYGDWADRIGNRETSAQVKQVIQSAKLLRSQLKKLLEPDLRQLGIDVVNHFPPRPRVTDGIQQPNELKQR
jgi:hypothetical protein